MGMEPKKITQVTRKAGAALDERPPVIDAPPSGALGPLKLDWPNAMRAVMEQQRVTRLGWGQPNVYILIADKSLCIRHADGKIGQLLVSDVDMFANDWVVVDDDA